MDPGARPSAREVLQVLQRRNEDVGKAKAKGEGGSWEKGKRRKSQSDQEGVSLALYRPSALPPLPVERAAPPAICSSSARQTLVRRIVGAVPREAIPIAIALLKCLSPSLVAHLLDKSSKLEESGRGRMLPSDSASLLILLLALVDLSSSLKPDSERHWWVSGFCWTTHFGLLFYLFRT